VAGLIVPSWSPLMSNVNATSEDGSGAVRNAPMRLVAPFAVSTYR
jgi:hypothetical protein